MEIPHSSSLRLSSPGTPLPPGSGHLLRFFCVNAIASIELDPTAASGGANGEDAASQAQQDIGEDRLAKLEREARAKSQRELAKINPSVTPKGQMAFDHISKMYVGGARPDPTCV